MRPGNLEVHWPEGEVLIDRRRRSPQAGIPDYNAIVRAERVEERKPARASLAMPASRIAGSARDPSAPTGRGEGIDTQAPMA
jgi:hypothetical protein